MVRKYLLLLFFPAFVFAQEMQHNEANWFAYSGRYNSSPNWGYLIEAQFRLDNELSRSNQTLFRLGFFYNLNSNSNVAAGYGLINTLDAEFDDYFHENRIWEQYQYNHAWNDKKNTCSNRFRLEQRFIGELGIEDGSVGKVATNYQNRFRFLNRHTIHLADFKSGNEELYFAVQDEVFLNLGSNKVNNDFFDQNRFLIGIGFNYKNSIQFEIMYMNQLINTTTATNIMNHTVSLTLYQNLILYREKQH
jgi:hypothetical protein